MKIRKFLESPLSGILFSLACFSYLLISTIPGIGSSGVFSPVRSEMKRALTGEYMYRTHLDFIVAESIMNMKRKDRSLLFDYSWKRLPPPKDKVLDAIDSYHGPVNYKEFKEHLKEKELDKSYMGRFYRESVNYPK